MDQEEVITLQSYRHNDRFAVVITRTSKKDVNNKEVFHYALGEHSGLIVNKPITDDITQLFDNALQIHVLCTLTDQQTDKSWTEIRRLLFNFRGGYSEDACKAAALDFHHDLLHPDIFQRDYCGFIITMMKIIQYRYPEISRIYCAFEPLETDDNECLKTILKHLEDCFPYTQTSEEISQTLGLDFDKIIKSLNHLISQNLVDKVGNGYILRSGLPAMHRINDETLSEYILSFLVNNKPNGMTIAQISDHVGYPITQIEPVLSTLVQSNRAEYDGNFYYAWSTPQSSLPSDRDIESLLELLESIHPDGVSRAEISDKICKRDVSSLLEYVITQGYALEKDGLYYIRRLEDSEIDLVYSVIRKGNGLSSDDIIGMTNLAEIVVLSSVNLLEEKGDILNVDNKYYATADDEETVRQAVLRDYSGTIFTKTLAGVTKISEERIAAVLSNMCLKGDLVSKSHGVFSGREITDRIREQTLKALQQSKNGIGLEDLARRIDEGSFFTQLVVSSLISDKLASRRGTKFFAVKKTVSIDDIQHDLIVRVYDAIPSSKVDPNGNSAAEIAELVDIDGESASAILNYLTDTRLIVHRSGYYTKQAISDVDCSAVLGVLNKQQGISITEISRDCPQFNSERIWFILRDLIAAKKAKNVNELYHKVQDSDEPRCTDSDIGKVLRALEGVSPSGLSIREIAMKCRLAESVVKKALTNLTHRSFVMARDDKYFSRNFEDDCDEIIALLKESHPNGMVLGEICVRVGIQSQPLVKEILRYLIDEQSSVEMFGKLYFYSSSMSDRKISKHSVLRKAIIKILAESYPHGMTLAEIQRASDFSVSSTDLQQLVGEQSIYEENNKYYYNQKFELTDNDFEEVLKALEAAYPNSLTMYTLSKESKLSEENVAVILNTLIDQKQVTEVDKNVFIRSASITEKSLRKGEVQNAMDATIAILTSDYSAKVCVDLMMSNITTYFKYKLGGESSVYTLGTIGNRRVVATKFSHGYSQASAISSGNATTRLLGTFPRIEHVIILGLGGGVVDTVDISRHVRLGDVVVSYPGEESSIYFMATNFNFPRSDLEDIGDSTVTYTVKRWNCLDPELHMVVKNVYEETKDLAVFPWEEYISQGQTALSDDISSQDFHRPAQMTDPLSQKRGVRGSLLPRELDGRPRMCLGTIGAGRHLHKVENLKEQFVERSRVIAFDAEYDQVTESIHGNCVDSFMFIHGISDYTDGTENEMWQSYAALSAAAVMRYFVENL